MADEKKPEASSGSIEEKNELSDDDLEKVSGGFVQIPTTTVRSTEHVNVPFGISTPLPGTTVM